MNKEVELVMPPRVKLFFQHLLKVYRHSIAAKVGDISEVRGYLVNLMYYTATHKGPLM